MIALVCFLVESLEEQVLRLRSVTVMRAILVILSLVMLSYAPMIGGLLIWAATVRYAPMALHERQKRHRIALARKAADDNAAAVSEVLRRLQAHTVALEQEIDRLRASEATKNRMATDPSYRSVGLHERAPDWLVIAARRAYRTYLHPDRHPRHREQAHDRFVQAETVFDTIYAQRQIRA
ncbi:J domain-containing protein [Methylorubrum aminovorans]